MTFKIENNKNQVAKYEAGQYIYSSEVVWRILKFPIYGRYSSALHLAVHVENGQHAYFDCSKLHERVNNPPETTLLNLCNFDGFAKNVI